jgi:hypothetical protein
LTFKICVGFPRLSADSINVFISFDHGTTRVFEITVFLGCPDKTVLRSINHKLDLGEDRVS